MDNCQGCQALRAEIVGDSSDPYWEEHLLWTAEHLALRGWAGGYSPAERLFLDSHPPKWYAAAQENGRKLAMAYPQNRLIQRAKNRPLFDDGQSVQPLAGPPILTPSALAKEAS